MNKNEFSPYIRVAMFSTLTAPFKINDRVIFDYEIILATNGKCKITIDNTQYLCKKNDVIFLRPGIRHEFISVDNTDFVQPHIHFDLTYSSNLSEKRFVSFKSKETMSDNERELIQKDAFENMSVPYVFTPFDLDKFQKLFFETIEIFNKKEYNYELLYKAKMLELLDCILVQFDQNTVMKPDTIYNAAIAVKNYIDNNYIYDITLDALSKQFYINKFTLMRNFERMYRKSVISYYRSKRLEYIKNMLKSTNISISALSEKMYFADVSSLSRFFRTYEGCSPKDYRKKYFTD